ncbi:MAG TPA: HNH endonuclease [Gammaproteobacteria bacterium]|nr:HNH endonuclease [Gammaproteobacteria bacterium]
MTSASPTAPRRAHTDPIVSEAMAIRAAFVLCRVLMGERGHSVMGLAVHGKSDLNDAIRTAIGQDVIRALGRNNKFEVNGITIYLLTERIQVRKLEGPVLAACVDPGRLNAIISCAGVTDVVFVPSSDDDLAAYLAAHPESDEVEVEYREPVESGDTDENLSKHHRERMVWFDQRYDVIANRHLLPADQPVHIGDKTHRVCRYCGKAKPEATFKNIAHAFPEQIGNKTLFDWMECDACNEHFSRIVEDDFSKWTHPIRTMGRVCGKRGIPTLKSSDRALRVEGENAKQLRISLSKDDVRCSVDEENKRVTLTLERQPYVPMGVFKCLVKMALAVMPVQETSACNHLKRWILEPSHTYESYPYRPLNILFQSIPGPLPNDQITSFLLRRKNDRIDCPFLIFVLQFSNAVYQVALPMHEQDRALLDGEPFELGLFPHAWGTVDHELTFGVSGHKVADMSGSEAVKGDVMTIHFRYDHAVDGKPLPSSGTE